MTEGGPGVDGLNGEEWGVSRRLQGRKIKAQLKGGRRGESKILRWLVAELRPTNRRIND
jgi:hypothetical protein